MVRLLGGRQARRLNRAGRRLRGAWDQWRDLGPRRGTAAAIRVGMRPAAAGLREARLRRRPLRVGEAEVRRAVGGDAVAVLRGPVLQALPTVARWEEELDLLSPVERDALLERAESLARHRFDLLGSGPVDLGARIDWLADFKTGRRWPSAHISRLPIVLGHGSDIKVPWELSRFQHLPLLAAAHRISSDEGWLDEIGAQLEHWLRANPVEFGPNWACTMDVAIRAANWTATLVIVGERAAGRAWFDAALRSLLLHGRFIRTHLEWAPVRGNHYLSDIVGLITVAALFQGSEEGRGWLRFAMGELETELAHQVREDGCDHEASIPYHRLVAELSICGLQVSEALSPGRQHAASRARLSRMLQFVADYTRPDGLAPQVGDADDGRYLPLGDYGTDPRSHEHLFRQAGVSRPAPNGHVAYPAGGYWIMRAGDLYVLVRCGDVGVGGVGSHAHNDALAFEFALGQQPLVIDPGSYLYTADPSARNRFRSTAFHSTLQIDGVEQNPLDTDTLFAMSDRRRAEPLEWSADPHHPQFVGAHHGYEELAEPATHTRRIALDVAASTLHISDRVTSVGAHLLQWTFPLAPAMAQADGSRAVARFPAGVILEIESPDMELSIEPGWMAPSYGRRQAVPFVRGRKRMAEGIGEDVTEIILRAR